MTEAERRRTVTVFDTTLRDGEQAPGASLGQAAKVRAAHAIADLGVDVLEAGFPAASAGEAEAVARIAREVRGPTIAALARAGQADVETAARSIGGAGRSRIHVFIATSDIHLGLAVANTLAAVGAGADQVHVTVNGLGERGGNASLEETVMALRCRADWYRVDVGVRQERLVVASRIVSELTGIPVQPNKAIVGANAFAHASGIHQDGVLKDPRTYEIMSPQSVGWEARRIVVSKLSGRRGLAARLAELGVPLEGEALERAYALAMRRGDEVHALDEHDLIAIAAQARRPMEEQPTF